MCAFLKDKYYCKSEKPLENLYCINEECNFAQESSSLASCDFQESDLSFTEDETQFEKIQPEKFDFSQPKCMKNVRFVPAEQCLVQQKCVQRTQSPYTPTCEDKFKRRKEFKCRHCVSHYSTYPNKLKVQNTFDMIYLQNCYHEIKNYLLDCFDDHYYTIAIFLIGSLCGVMVTTVFRPFHKIPRNTNVDDFNVLPWLLETYGGGILLLTKWILNTVSHIFLVLSFIFKGMCNMVSRIDFSTNY